MIFKKMPKNNLLNIKTAAMDNWDLYIKAINKWYPYTVEFYLKNGKLKIKRKYG